MIWALVATVVILSVLWGGIALVWWKTGPLDYPYLRVGTSIVGVAGVLPCLSCAMWLIIGAAKLVFYLVQQ